MSTAQYRAKTIYCTATFYNHSGTDKTLLKTDTVTYGSTPTPPSNPTLSGWTFAGWSPSVGPITSDTIYYATWTKSFSVNGSIGTETTDVLSVGDTCTLPKGATFSSSLSGGTLKHNSSVAGHTVYVGAGVAIGTSYLGRRFIYCKWDNGYTTASGQHSFTINGSNTSVLDQDYKSVWFYAVKIEGSDGCRVTWDVTESTLYCTLR